MNRFNFCLLSFDLLYYRAISERLHQELIKENCDFGPLLQQGVFSSYTTPMATQRNNCETRSIFSLVPPTQPLAPGASILHQLFTRQRFVILHQFSSTGQPGDEERVKTPPFSCSICSTPTQLHPVSLSHAHTQRSRNMWITVCPLVPLCVIVKMSHSQLTQGMPATPAFFVPFTPKVSGNRFTPVEVPLHRGNGTSLSSV